MLKTSTEKLEEINEEHKSKAYEYFDYRVKAVKAKNYITKELVERLPKYRKQKSNIGVEMAHLWRFEEASHENDQEYLQNYYDYENFTAKYKGIERVLDALHSQSIALQSSIKYIGNAEKFSSYE